MNTSDNEPCKCNMCRPSAPAWASEISPAWDAELAEVRRATCEEILVHMNAVFCEPRTRAEIADLLGRLQRQAPVCYNPPPRVRT
jgi:hypothetical protein